MTKIFAERIILLLSILVIITLTPSSAQDGFLSLPERITIIKAQEGNSISNIRSSSPIPNVMPDTDIIYLSADPTPSPDKIEKAKEEALEAYFNKWKVSLTPYWFFFTLNAQVKVGDRVSNAVLTPDDINKQLDGGFCARLDVNKGHWGGFVDVNDLKLYNAQSTSRLASTMSFTSMINHYCVYYRFKGSPVFDIYGGARSFMFNTDLNVQAGRFPAHTISNNNSWADPIIGARITVPISKTFLATLGGDFGGADTHNSSSAYIMASWLITKNISLNGGYDILNLNYNKGGGLSTFDLNARMTGPMISIGISF